MGAPDVPAAVADLVHGVVNSPMSIYEMGPAAHAMERVVVEWMIEKVGWGKEAGGVLTHGGSLPDSERWSSSSKYARKHCLASGCVGSTGRISTAENVSSLSTVRIASIRHLLWAVSSGLSIEVASSSLRSSSSPRAGQALRREPCNAHATIGRARRHLDHARALE